MGARKRPVKLMENTAKKSMMNDLTKGPILKILVTLAVPFMFSNLLMTLYSMVDMIVVGQFVGSTGLSAVTQASMITNLMSTLAMGFSTSGQILISQQIGINDKQGVKTTIGSLFSTVGIIGLIMTVVGVTLYNPMLSVLNTPAEAFSQAVDYLVICSAGNIFTCGYVCVSAILRGMGDSKKPFVFIAIASVTNVVLDLLFVAVFHWEAAGAAWATIIGQAVSFISSIIYLYKKREQFGFDFALKSFRINPSTFKILFRLGLPMAIQSSAITVSMLFVSSIVNQFGLAASSTFGVGRRVEMIPMMMTNAFSMAASTIIGQNMAAGKVKRSKKVVYTTLCFTTGIFVIAGICFALWPKAVFSLFTTDAAVLEMSTIFIQTILVAFPAFAIMPAFNCFIQGIGNAKVSLIIALLDGVVARISLTYLFAYVFEWGIPGLFLGYCLAAYVTAIPSALYFFSGVWKKRKLLVAGPSADAE